VLIQYAELQITRVALWSDGPVDLLAYVTRNFLEWSLWCTYLSEAPTNIDTPLKIGADTMDMIKFNPALNPTLHARVFPPDDKGADLQGCVGTGARRHPHPIKDF
jgi:hypothetical protein